MTSFKAPTLRQQGAYGVQPHEVAFTRPTPPEQPAGVNRVKAVKALREEHPHLGLKEALDIVDGKAPWPGAPVQPDVLELSDAELKAAKAAIRQVHANPDVKLQEVIAAINKVRSNDPVGTLRKASNGKYAFSYEPGKWLIIDVDQPAYKAVDSLADNEAIKGSWNLVALG